MLNTLAVFENNGGNLATKAIHYVITLSFKADLHGEMTSDSAEEMEDW